MLRRLIFSFEFLYLNFYITDYNPRVWVICNVSNFFRCWILKSTFVFQGLFLITCTIADPSACYIDVGGYICLNNCWKLNNIVNSQINFFEHTKGRKTALRQNMIFPETHEDKLILYLTEFVTFYSYLRKQKQNKQTKHFLKFEISNT